MKCLFLFVSIFSSLISASEIVLKDKTLGSLPLTKPISVDLINKHFPNYRVTHQIASGDSPDFHKVSVFTKSDEPLFYTVSYLSNDTKETDLSYKIDLLVILSPLIRDKYNVRVGDKVVSAIKKRGTEITIVGGHFNNSIGSDSIYYQITIPPTKEDSKIGLDFYHPDYVSMDMVLNSNPSIESISWPVASWE